METRHKILLLDDDPEVLTMYQEVLEQMPSQPEIRTANSGPRAMAMLEAEPFRLLICDLKMPKMDGLQVLSIVRRKYPQLRTVALTNVADEQFRSRAYSLGVDQFWYKPASEQEIRMFLECLEALLGRESETGFRGVQSKSLVDIIQLECISQSSSVLRITNGQSAGKIWIQEGELVDAEAGELNGEPAFQKILAWRTGNFETLPPEPNRRRNIFKSYNALLLETAHAMDETLDQVAAGFDPGADLSPLAQLSQMEGVEFVLTMKPGGKGMQVARGLENPENVATWARESLERFNVLGNRWHAGPLEQIECLGPQRHVALASQADTEFCVGWKHTLTAGQVRDMMRKVLALWAS